MASKSKRRSKNAKRKSRSSLRLSDSGGINRPRKQSLTLTKSMFRKLGVGSLAFLNTIKGDIESFESDNGDFNSFFMRDQRGPVLLVSNLRDQPDRHDAEEIAADIRQVHGDAFPRTLVMQVQRGREENAVQTMNTLIDLVNSEATDGRQLALSEPVQDFPDRKTVSLIFHVKGLPEQNNVPPVIAREESMADSISDDDSSSNGNGTGKPARQQGEPATPRQRDDNPAADLLNDKPLVPVISVEDFKKATRERHFGREGTRTPDYNKLVGSLEGYHRHLQDYRKAAEVLKREITEVGTQKQTLVRRVIELQDQRKQKIEAVLKDEQRIQQLLAAEQKQPDALLQPAEGHPRTSSTPEPVLTEPGTPGRERSPSVTLAEQSTLESGLLLQKLEAGRAEIARLDREIVAEKEKIKPLEDTLNDRLEFSRELIRRYQGRLAEQAETIITDGKKYLDEKNLLRKGDKIKAVESLILQVTDADQNLQRLKEETRRVWQADFPNQLTAPGSLLNTGTVSEVFQVETNGIVGDSGSRYGFAKRAAHQGEQPNAATENIGIAVGELADGKYGLIDPPNLIARQVLSSRLNKEFGFNVIADEVFSADTDGTTLGVTGKAPGKQVMRNQPVPPFLHNHLGPDGSILKTEVIDTVQVHTHINFKDKTIQKNLSDLQLMDAITGQMDRHLGNIFIDERTGQVTGIDNDQAFPADKVTPVTDNTLELFRKEQGKLVYLQEQIDKDSAAKILAMDEDRFREIMRGEVGDPERLAADDPAIEHAVARLRAVKEKIKELSGPPSQLIGDAKPWGPDTYQEALDNGTSQIFNRTVKHNYLIRAVEGYQNAADPSNPNKKQEAQGG